MKYIDFGTHGLKASEIVLDTMRIIGKDKTTVEGIIRTALEYGINTIDTADCYGNGKSESLIGQVLKDNPELRDKMVLQTKCGIIKEDSFTYFDFSKEHILKAVDDSLMRLHTDHVDSLLLHRPDALMEPDQIAEAFQILYDQGKVLDFGVSNMNPEMIELIKSEVSFPLIANQVQLSCAFTPAINAGFNVNMMNDASVMHDGGILEYCRRNKMIIQAWSTMQYGYFEGVFIGSDKYKELNKVLERIAGEQGTTPTAVALAWILRYPGKVQTVIGTTTRSISVNLPQPAIWFCRTANGMKYMNRPEISCHK